MRQRLLFVSIVLFVTTLFTSPAARADDPITGQAFPYQAGFPRSDPRGTISLSSPAVVDLNNDGGLDIMLADGAGCVWAWNNKGQVLPGFPWHTFGSCSGTPRIYGPVAVGNVDGDPGLEVVAGTRALSSLPGELGRVYVWNAGGSVLPGWPREMGWNPLYSTGDAEVYSVALANVTGDARLEVIAGTSNNASNIVTSSEDSSNLYVWQGDGSLLPGYPTWYKTGGIYGLVGAANLTGDDHAEVVAARDHLYVHVYDDKGQYLPGWPARTFVGPSGTWGVDPYLEFTNNAPVMGDLDGNGRVEIIVAGKVRDPQRGHSVVNSAVLVLERDGGRHAGWQTAKLGGGPLDSSFPPSQAPALADLDNDGKLEIVVALFDGTLRVYRENGSLWWSYNFAQGQRLFGSEPAIGDVTGDGQLDILFGTYSPDGSAHNLARLYGLSATGQPLAGFPLPLTREGNSDKRGLRAGPALADLDNDCDVEILAGSQAGELYVWDLPGRYRPALMPWPISRHDNMRTGAFSPAGGSPRLTNLATEDLPFKIYLPLVKGGC